ncbi:MAG: dihydroorotate dehydrogenase electron transfer subunit [Dehalococcoidia bacterium]|nr:dihydroorotate dehydrogenase electron transfer subunit [Dehalococcoidia bacterium]
MRQVTAKVISNNLLLCCPGSRYYLMRVRAPEIAVACRPGQFIMLKCGADTLLRRPISINSVIDNTDIELLYAVPDDDITNNYSSRQKGAMRSVLSTGAGTRWLSGITENSDISLLGPLGNGFTVAAPANRLLLIAGGIGIAPLKFLAIDSINKGKNVILLIGARSAAGILPQEMLPHSIETLIATEDGSLGKHGRILDFVEEYVNHVDQIFACGPQAMYHALYVQMNNWPAKKPVQLSLEVRMGCGIGICNSCSIKTKQGMKRICKEGPVFDIGDIIWQEVRI